MASDNQLNAVQEKIKKLNKAFERLNNQEKKSRLDIDAFLMRIRELYELSYELKPTTEQPSDSEKPDHEKPPQSVKPSEKPDSESSDTNVNTGSNANLQDNELKEKKHEESQPESSGKSGKPKAEDYHAGEGEENEVVASGENSNLQAKGLESDITEEESINEGSDSTNHQQETKASDHSGTDSLNEEDDEAHRKAIYEKFQREKTSLHEQLRQKQQGKALADKYQLTPISDLKTAIGLNERAAFIRELFNGDKETFFKTLDKLNNLESYEDALNYLENSIKKQYGWKDGSNQVVSFLELIYRRFLTEN